ncbi:hypothetical protein [Paenibacillus planticolens]|uniref:hypothetical protein n=1 Tax=Paenibacillus planticolens TaxID=2654976 RepID=UPI001491CF76|nr:hypothetical protein [Paenibacillus planticolens]
MNEFVSFYESAELNPSEKFALMSLIISSFDDAVTEGKIEDGIWEKIIRGEQIAAAGSCSLFVKVREVSVIIAVS